MASCGASRLAGMGLKARTTAPSCASSRVACSSRPAPTESHTPVKTRPELCFPRDFAHQDCRFDSGARRRDHAGGRHFDLVEVGQALLQPVGGEGGEVVERGVAGAVGEGHHRDAVGVEGRGYLDRWLFSAALSERPPRSDRGEDDEDGGRAHL